MHDILRNIVMIHCSKSKTFLFLLPTKKNNSPSCCCYFLGVAAGKGRDGCEQEGTGRDTVKG